MFFLYLSRSFTISEDFLTIDGLKINFDFIATPTTEPRKASVQWNHFFKRVPWDVQQSPAPSRLMAMEITPGVVYYYDHIPPFDLAEDGCASWLDWHIHTLVNGNDIRALRTRDPRTDTSLSNTDLDRKIGSRINYELYYSYPHSTVDPSDSNSTRPNKRRSPDYDDDESPLTAKYLRDSLDRQYDRFTRELNRVSNRLQYNRNRQQYNGPSQNNQNNQPLSTPLQPTAQLQAIPASHSGNALSFSQLSNDDILALLRNRTQ